jgi:hypothetical protein
MAPNVIMFGWNRPLVGREHMSAQHFQEFSEFLRDAKQRGLLQSYEAVLLEHHGGKLNGFFLLFGEPAKLSELSGSPEWMRHQVRAGLHLDGASTLRGFVGAAVLERMGEWVREIPK